MVWEEIAWQMDKQSDGQTDGGIPNIPIAFLKKRGNN